MKKPEWITALRLMFEREYWTKANTVEFFAFLVKAAIIIPGLLFGVELWWLYIFALVTSISLVWSSTVKTIPTLIWFNIVWSVLASVKLIQHFVS
jgi:hypothetical protein